VFFVLYDILRIATSKKCGSRRRPPDMEGSCGYIELAVADSRQGVALQLGGSTGSQKFVTKETSMLQN
jgi:hypothetical protein